MIFFFHLFFRSAPVKIRRAACGMLVMTTERISLKRNWPVPSDATPYKVTIVVMCGCSERYNILCGKPPHSRAIRRAAMRKISILKSPAVYFKMIPENCVFPFFVPLRECRPQSSRAARGCPRAHGRARAHARACAKSATIAPLRIAPSARE